MTSPTDLGMPSVPEKITVTRYRCPHCRITRAAKRAITDHMTRCWNNAATRSCRTCANFRPADKGGCCEACATDEKCMVGVILPDTGLVTNCDKWEITW